MGFKEHAYSDSHIKPNYKRHLKFYSWCLIVHINFVRPGTIHFFMNPIFTRIIFVAISFFASPAAVSYLELEDNWCESDGGKLNGIEEAAGPKRTHHRYEIFEDDTTSNREVNTESRNNC